MPALLKLVLLYCVLGIYCIRTDKLISVISDKKAIMIPEFNCSFAQLEMQLTAEHFSSFNDYLLCKLNRVRESNRQIKSFIERMLLPQIKTTLLKDI